MATESSRKTYTTHFISVHITLSFCTSPAVRVSNASKNLVLSWLI